jgi:hypothetical protein
LDILGSTFSKNTSDTDFVSIDTEYTGDHTLTLQIHFHKLKIKVIVINSRLYDLYPEKRVILNLLKEEWENRPDYTDLVFYEDLDDPENNNLDKILNRTYNLYGFSIPKRVKLLFFYAVRDLYPCFGFLNLKDPMLQKHKRFQSVSYISRKNNIRGKMVYENTCYLLCDLFGLSNGGLVKLAASVGISMLDKKGLDTFKANMQDAMLSESSETRYLFQRYSMDDATVLYDILERRVEQHNLSLSTIGLDEKDFFTMYNLPLTAGRLVASTFESWLERQSTKKTSTSKSLKNVSKEKTNQTLFGSKTSKTSEYKLALYKIGYLNVHARGYKDKLLQERSLLYEFDLKKNKRKRLTKQSLVPSLCNNKDFELPSNNKDFELPSLFRDQLINNHCNKYNYLFNGYGLASIPFLQTFDSKRSTATLAPVTGGRAINERYRELSSKNVLDIDLKSCYGTCLLPLHYPVGRPTIFSVCVNKKGSSLGEFLDENKNDLVPDLWKVIVCGKLSFPQDLVYSKVLSKKHQDIAFGGSDFSFDLDDNISNDHLLLKKEIEGGVITHDVLQLIKKVSTNNEWNDWMGLQVKSACYWPASKRVDNAKDWTEKVNESQGPTHKIKWWFGVPLEGYIKPLLDKRVQVKQSILTETDPVKQSELKGLDVALKLSVNSLYGVITSIYFPIGNSVLADVITAKARVEIWKTIKPLRCYQTVTDGGSFSPGQVFYWKELQSQAAKTSKPFNFRKQRLPGMSYFSDIYLLETHRSIRVQPLFGWDWDKLFSSWYINAKTAEGTKKMSVITKQLNKDIKNYLNDFWKPFGVTVCFDYELKQEHHSWSGSCLGKAHYKLSTIYDTSIYKLRGHQEYIDGSRNGIFDYIDYLERYQGKQFPDHMSYRTKNILSISQWRVAYLKDQAFTGRPGDVIISEPHEIRLSPSYLPSYTLKSARKKEQVVKSTKFLPYQKHFNLVSPLEVQTHMLRNYSDSEALQPLENNLS